MDWLQSIYITLSNFTNGVGSVLSYIWSFFQSLWYGLTTILTGAYDIAVSIFTSGFFS